MSETGVPKPIATRKQRRERRVPRACDNCRIKKTRCDGTHAQGDCSNCKSQGTACTYTKSAPKKQEPIKSYTLELERKLEKLQSLFEELNPGVEPLANDTVTQRADSPSAHHSGPTPASLIPKMAHEGSSDDSGADSDGFAALPSAFGRLSINSSPGYHGYHEHSGTSGLVKIALSFNPKPSGTRQRAFIKSLQETVMKAGPWEDPAFMRQQEIHTLPEIDLLRQLVGLYFTHANPFWPLLCQKFVERDITERKYFTDGSFRTTLLLICAIAARNSEDLRVFTVPGEFNSRGWQWFHQAQASKPALIEPYTLADIHFYALSSIFLLNSWASRSSWSFVAHGITIAISLGIHRRHAYSQSWSANDELWKRAFWVLVALDRTVSVILGRPCSIQDEDFDLDFPAEVDDEYWDPDNMEKVTAQPPGQPPTISYFNSYLRLLQIISVALRTIYCINRSKTILGFVGKEWEQRILSELDTAINRWLSSGVPEHLRWNQNRPSGIFFDQSLALHMYHHFTRMFIHRPFIMDSTRPSSLATCASAARACAHILAQNQPIQSSMVQLLALMPVFTSGTLLLINKWVKTSNEATPSVETKDMEGVGQCIEALRQFSLNWQTGAPMSDLLRHFSEGDFAMPQKQSNRGPEHDFGKQSIVEEGWHSRRVGDLAHDHTLGGATPLVDRLPSNGAPADGGFWYPGAHADPASWPSGATDGAFLADGFGDSSLFPFGFPLFDEQVAIGEDWGSSTMEFESARGDHV